MEYDHTGANGNNATLVSGTGDGITDYYLADVSTATDYYLFGMQMPKRNFGSADVTYTTIDTSYPCALCQNFAPGLAGWYASDPSVHLAYVGGSMQIADQAPWHGAEIEINTIPGQTYTVNAGFTFGVDYVNDIEVWDSLDYYILGSTYVYTGSPPYTCTFTANEYTTLIKINKAGGSTVDTFYVDSIMIRPTTPSIDTVIHHVSNGDYRYGFNGKEKDNEVKPEGKGNSLDFGARIYDSRLGRWMSLDPLQKKYSYISPYNFVLNTPMRAFDPDGRVVTFADEESQITYIKVYNSASAEYQAKLDKLECSEVEYRINVNTSQWTTGSTDPNLLGENAYDFTNNRLMVEVSVNLKGKARKAATLGDELIGASQYEEGKFGYIINKSGEEQTLGYDMHDEIEQKNGELEISECLMQENPDYKMDDDIALYKSFKDKGKPEKYFSKSQYGKMYKFSPAAPAFGNVSLSNWLDLYKKGEIKGAAFKANVDDTKKDDGGSPVLSAGGKDEIVLPKK